MNLSLFYFVPTSRYISSDIEDLCPEAELFLILKKELHIPDSYRLTEKQKNELYTLLNCTENMKQKRQLPYNRLLHLLSKTLVEEWTLFSQTF